MSGCLSPLFLKKTGQFVPCGKCYNCVSQRRNSWTFRLMCESYHHPYSAFLTLTYDDDHLPLNSLGKPSLVVDHLIKFFKSLRNANKTVKYYAIGEYGGKLGRPHYHAIVFYEDRDLFFGEYWPFGSLFEGAVTPASIHYVSKFHMYPKASGLKSDFTQRPFCSNEQEARFSISG